MWPQLGYRQGYSDGEDGGVLLNKRLAIMGIINIESS